MAEIVMPTDLYINQSEVTQHRFDMEENSPQAGSTRGRVFGPPRWGIKLGSGDSVTPTQSNAWESMLLKLRGRINHLSAYDPGRRVPRGTMRGSPVVSSGATAGASSFVLSGASGTLLPGDWLQVGSGLGSSMLIKITDSVTASGGTATINFEPPLRMNFSAGTPTTWDHARGYYRVMSGNPSWVYEAGADLQGGFTVELLEAFL